MNVQQRLFLWLGTFVFAFIALHPPWITRFESPRPGRKALAVGRELIDNYVRVAAVSQPDGLAY